MIGEVGQVAQDPHFCYLPELGYKLEHFSNGGVTGGNEVRLKRGSNTKKMGKNKTVLTEEQGMCYTLAILLFDTSNVTIFWSSLKVLTGNSSIKLLLRSRTSRF